MNKLSKKVHKKFMLLIKRMMRQLKLSYRTLSYYTKIKRKKLIKYYNHTKCMKYKHLNKILNFLTFKLISHDSIN